MRHLKIEFLNNKKQNVWYDRDIILFFAMFQILVDFIEKEFVCDWFVDWDWDEVHQNAKSEMLDLYDWFIENSENDCEKLFDLMFYDRELIKTQLKLIIDISGFMWT